MALAEKDHLYFAQHRHGNATAKANGVTFEAGIPAEHEIYFAITDDIGILLHDNGVATIFGAIEQNDFRPAIAVGVAQDCGVIQIVIDGEKDIVRLSR